jgi:hypothetical protein
MKFGPPPDASDRSVWLQRDHETWLSRLIFVWRPLLRSVLQEFAALVGIPGSKSADSGAIISHERALVEEIEVKTQLYVQWPQVRRFRRLHQAMSR